MRNELESLSYDLRTNLSEYGTLEKYADDNTKKIAIEKLNQTVEWLYTEEGKNSHRDIYKAKLDEYIKLGQPIKERMRFYSELPVFIN